MTFIGILVFILNGILTVETRAYDSFDACAEGLNKVMASQMADPHFDAGLYANCVASKIVKVEQLKMGS